MMMKIRPILLLLLVLQISPTLRLSAAEDWQVVNVDGREYLTLDNVAEFYHLTATPGVDPQHVEYSGARARIETLSNARELDVNGVKQWLSYPVVYRDGKLMVSRFDLAKTIDPCLRPAMISNLEPFHTVVLDAGHGGQDGGGHTPTGFEKDYTMDVIRDLKTSLETKGFNVVLTRQDDVYLSLEQRADFANTIANAVFVSVHFNSGEAEARGLEVFAMTPRGASSTSDTHPALDQVLQMPGNDFDNASLALANCVQHSILGHLDETDRGVKRARFAVLRLTHAPAILVEGGFMTSSQDSRLITDGVWRQNLAEAIVAGVRSYQDLVQFRQPPKLLADYRNEQPPPTNVVSRVAALGFHPQMPNPSFLAVSNRRPASRSQNESRLITVPPRKY